MCTPQPYMADTRSEHSAARRSRDWLRKALAFLMKSPNCVRKMATIGLNRSQFMGLSNSTQELYHIITLLLYVFYFFLLSRVLLIIFYKFK